MTERSKLTDRQKLEDKINRTPEVQRIEVARKTVDDEVIYRFVIVYGNDTLGYIASSEEWFSPNRKGEDIPEFYEVLFQSPICATVPESLNDAMHSAKQEAEDFMADAVAPEPPEKPAINPSDYEITDGYVGSLGKTYKRATQESLAEAIEAAAKRLRKTPDEIIAFLDDGKAVAWCDSPNYYYDHSVGIIRRKRNLPPVQLVACSCGHSVPKSQVMNASMGTSCPDCYDRMSD